MLRDDELPPLPTPERVMLRLTAMQHIEGKAFLATQVREYGRAVERAAYKAAAAACKRAADKCLHPDECVEAIEALMQEQPK